MNPRISHHALLAGCCALVPVPLLDGWLERRAHRAMIRSLAQHSGISLDDASLHVLTEDRSSLLVGCLWMMVAWPIKKLFRTILYFLTVKDVIDGATRAALIAAMVHAAADHLPANAERVRAAIDATLERWQYSPLSRTVLRGDRPRVEWLVAPVPAPVPYRMVGWLYTKGGGGPILDDFRRRLAEA